MTAAAMAALVASAVQALIPLLTGRESLGSTLVALGASVLYAALGALVVVPLGGPAGPPRRRATRPRRCGCEPRDRSRHRGCSSSASSCCP